MWAACPRRALPRCPFLDNIRAPDRPPRPENGDAGRETSLGNVVSAMDWAELLLPEIDRQFGAEGLLGVLSAGTGAIRDEKRAGWPPIDVYYGGPGI